MAEESSTRNAFDLLSSSRGDLEAYHRIFTGASKPLFDLVYCLTRSLDDSVDIISQAFAKVFFTIQSSEQSWSGFQASLYREAWIATRGVNAPGAGSERDHAEASEVSAPTKQGEPAGPAGQGSIPDEGLLAVLLEQVAHLPSETAEQVLGCDAVGIAALKEAARERFSGVDMDPPRYDIDFDKTWEMVLSRIMGGYAQVQPCPAGIPGVEYAVTTEKSEPKRRVTRKSIVNIAAVAVAVLAVGIGSYFLLVNTVFANKTVPSLAGLTKAAAEKRTEASSLKIKVSFKNTGTPRTGDEVVSKQTPKSGTRVKKGTTVSVVLEDAEMEAARGIAEGQLGTANARLAELQSLGINNTDLSGAITTAQDRYNNATCPDNYAGPADSSTFWSNTVIQQCDARKAAYLEQKESQRQAAERTANLKAAVVGEYYCVTTREESLTFNRDGTFLYEGEGVKDSGTYSVGDGFLSLSWASGFKDRMTVAGGWSGSGRPSLETTFDDGTRHLWEPL